MKTANQMYQQGLHLSDQGWAAFAERHEDIKTIAFGGSQDDIELIRAVFTHVDCELHLKKHEAKSAL